MIDSEIWLIYTMWGCVKIMINVNIDLSGLRVVSLHRAWLV